MAWILMYGRDGFGNDVCVSSSEIYLDYEKACEVAEKETKEYFKEIEKEWNRKTRRAYLRERKQYKNTYAHKVWELRIGYVIPLKVDIVK